jgi:tetratricopeptide (TPR) repeat protein
MAGCSATSSSTTASADLNRALLDYEAGHYATALQQAAAVQDRSLGVRNGEAAYLGGLAAYRLGDLDDARDRLDTAARATSPAIAGKARAVLGLVLMDQGQPQEAATNFATAAQVLSGENSRQAARHAAKAYRRAGDDTAAEAWQRVAEGRRAPQAAIVAAGRSAGFTLQAGAFRERPRAERAALEAAAVVEGHGLAPVRIVPRQDEWGDVLYVVQVGRFDSRAAAANARQRIGRLQYIVATVTPG